jgi:nitrogen fixation protein FixH
VSKTAFAVVLAVAVAGALGAVAANFLVGGRLFEPTVVANPYQAGLRYDADRRAAGEASCLASAGPCEQAGPGDLVVRLEVDPRPVRAMADLTFSVAARRGAVPVGDAEAEIALAMPGMYMGENRVRLASLGDGRYQGKGVIVRCPSGGRIWSAEVTLRRREPATAAPLRALFAIELAD